MDKETILEKSRKENKNSDLADLSAQKTASKVGVMVGWCSIALAMILTAIFNNRILCGYAFIFSAIESGIFITKYVMLKKRHELLVSIIYILLTAVFAVLFILQLMGMA